MPQGFIVSFFFVMCSTGFLHLVEFGIRDPGGNHGMFCPPPCLFGSCFVFFFHFGIVTHSSLLTIRFLFFFN